MNRRLLLFAVLALVYCLVSFHRVTMAVIGDLLAEEFRLGPSQLGSLGSVLLMCYAFMQMPSGVLADNFGPKRTILLALGLATGGSVLFAVSPGYTTAFVGRMLIGAGIGFIYLSAIKILSAWYKEEEFGTVLGLLMSLGMLGTLLATRPLADSVMARGWRDSFLLVAGLTVGLMLLVIFIVKSAPDTQEDQSASDEANGPNELGEGGDAEKPGVFSTIRMLLRDRDYLMLLIFMVAGSSWAGFQTLWAGPFLARAYGYSLVEVGNALWWFSMGGVLGAPLWGFLSDRLFKTRKAVLMLSTCIATTLWLIPAFAPHAIPRWAVPVLLFALTTSWSALILTHALIRETYSSEILGVAVGIMNFLTFLGGAVFTQVMGNIVELFDKVDGDYPLIAYQSTLMLLIGTWIIRIIALAFAKEKRAE
jgi:sugar phosphate permease